MERAAQQQLLRYFEKSQQFNASSHVYRSNLSTTTTLMEICDELYQGVEDRNIASVMALDQSAAFDCVKSLIVDEKARAIQCGS